MGRRRVAHSLFVAEVLNHYTETPNLTKLLRKSKVSVI